MKMASRYSYELGGRVGIRTAMIHHVSFPDADSLDEQQGEVTRHLLRWIREFVRLRFM